jgi:hypothetical protein
MLTYSDLEGMSLFEREHFYRKLEEVRAAEKQALAKD